jgi:molybdate transport system ATP-binding protein
MTTGPYMSFRSVPYHHQIHLEQRLGSLHLQVFAAFESPWSILFGPSGSGKSSILRALCGLLGDANPRIHRGDQGDPPGNNVSISQLAPHRRAIAYAPQQPSLFPHLSVRENIAFSQSIRSQAASALFDEVLALFGLQALADRTPARLSGGERQRVNLARAFAVPEAKLMLLDEPFTGLDLKLRDELLPRMRRFLAERGIPCVSVTHDVDEALLLDAEVFRIEAGRILMWGPARAVLAEERARLVDALQ